ncbi:uncharacterized protein LOC143486128 isoform X2 [Brachyhypopomus gauderio]|uniref:uncharacterized protein LOC143486128 isoform X2 n=1 Tax=Brachyhypopomus gauderio TaxID=698409 RepID=UPI00404108DA
MNTNIISFLAKAIVILLPTVMSGVFGDICTNYTTLSDPWRNIGFILPLHPGWPKSDIHLMSGWYRFTGIGGDHSDGMINTGMIKPCVAFDINNCDTNVTSTIIHCSTNDKILSRFNCTGGLILYYLEPTNGTYITSHSSCSPSPCGEHAQCNPSNGSCVCDTGLSIPDGFLPTGDSYGCTDFQIQQPQTCEVNFTLECLVNLLNESQISTAQVMPQNVMVNILATIHNNTYLLNAFESTTQSTMANYGNSILKATEKLVSIMVNNVKMDSTSINLPNLDIEIFKVGPNTTLTKIPQIKTSTAFLDIDLIAISKHNNGSTAVVFMTYSNMLNMLKPDTNTNAVKTMMSIVVTVMVLPISNNPSTVNHNPSPSRDIDYPHTSQTTDDPKMPLQVPYNVTLNNPDYHQHYDASCVTWSGTKWVNGFCHVTWKNDSYTVCSCVHPETLALLMQIEDSVSDPTLELLDIIAESVGLVFLSLALLTFALCRRNTRLTNTAQINLCLSLLLAHLLFLLTQQFLQYIQPIQLACVTLAGVLLFLFLSAFVWMFIEAVLLFIAVRNLSNIRSKQKEVLSWKWLIIIGYVIPLVIVSVSAGLFPDGFGSDNCWLKKDEQFFWSFLGPVCFILTANWILFIIIFVIVTYTLKHMDREILHNNYRTANELKKRVILKTLAQSVILGCPWILGFFSSYEVQIIYLVLNSQQGTFIFLLHCVFNQEVYAEFQRITNQNLPNKFYAQLDHYTPRLMTMFQQKASKTGRVSDALVDILKAHDEQELHDVHTRRTTVLRALPVLLREDVLGFYKTSMDDPNEIELGDVPVALFITGSENVDDPVHYHPVKVSIVLESDVVTKFCRLADAFLVLFGLIYGLHLSYPKGLTSTFEFVQKILLGLEDGKLSPKLQTIKNDLMV